MLPPAAGTLLKIGIHCLFLVQSRMWWDFFQAENNSACLKHRCVSSPFEDILGSKQVKKEQKTSICHFNGGIGKNTVSADGSRLHTSMQTVVHQAHLAFANVGGFRKINKQKNSARYITLMRLMRQRCCFTRTCWDTRSGDPPGSPVLFS